jgi:DNA-directed RNA polymerase specialized sigma24 family protein
MPCNQVVQLQVPLEGNRLRLVYLQQKKIEEAAICQNITTAAANMRLVRARRSLAKRLKEWQSLIA